MDKKLWKTTLQAIGMFVFTSLFFIPTFCFAFIDSKVTSDDVLYSEIDKSNIYETKVFYQGDIITQDFDSIKDNVLIKDNIYRIYGLPFYKDDMGFYRSVEFSTTTTEYYNENLKQNNFSFFFPLLIHSAKAQQFFANGADGIVEYIYEDTWSIVRDSANGESVTANLATDHIKTEDEDGGTNYTCSRAIFSFDTSSLDDDILIASSSFFIKGDQINGTQEFTLQEVTLISEPTIAVGDYDGMPDLDTPIASGTDSNISFDSYDYEEFVFNSEGLSWINKTGYTNIMLREALHDIYDNIPTSANRTYTGFYFSETSGTLSDPYLEIGTYSEESTSTPEATSSELVASDMEIFNDLGFITAYTEHYESSSTQPDWVEKHIIHIPQAIIYLLLILFLWTSKYIIAFFSSKWRKTKFK